MHYGFTFNNIHSEKMGITVRTKNKPIIPKPKIATSSISARDGHLDFSVSNPYGHMMFEQREISLSCSFIKKSLEDLRKTARDIAMWLAYPEARLIFDDEPDVYYIARVSNRLDLEQQLYRGNFQIVFSCQPYARSIKKSGVISSYGEGNIYDGTLRYGGENIFNITAPEAITVLNKGTYVRPIIKIDGSFDEISLTCNNKTLNCNSAQKDTLIIIDCEKMTAIKGNTQNALPTISGDFTELKNGENIIEISGSNIDCKVAFEFNYLYI